ncbi:HAD-IIA family hydrolase [Arthrobacter mobilis]|uniref:HAD-IIA family hydrolase n=1 Tax=Arthrobacter mobilis TaxID=2724944 RepID=A0A7X6K7W5_9MICC|nr:HAD-IIA family hydrolase [Arthrobacter mobilis]NKX56813.1 HAD-IIA family hydrolase [Arthrobacter mobilis]
MTETALISGYDALLSDLDGVVYAGPGAISGAVEALDRLARTGTALGYITNNASRSPEEVAAHLRSLGAPAAPGQVFGSAWAGAQLLARHVPAGSRVLVTGSRFLARMVEDQGMVPVRSAEDSPAAVIQGFDPSLGWQDLAEAAYAVARGAVWVATNTDMSIPRDRGIAPGNGALVAAVRAATGAVPLVAGKPEAELFEAAAASLGSVRPLVVGDRLDTDILGGNNAGMDTAAVLTGVDTVESVLAARSAERPRYLLGSLRELHLPYPDVVADGGGFRCGDSSAVVVSGKLRISGSRQSLDTWRCACAAWWQEHPGTDRATSPELVQ